MSREQSVSSLSVNSRADPEITDAQVCEFALRNPDKKVRALAMKMLDYLAKDGNPYACEIFKRYTKAGGYPNDGGKV